MIDSTYLLISDFNSGNLAAFLRNDDATPALEVREAPYDQVLPILAEADHPCWAEGSQGVVVWTRPEGVSPTFAGILRGQAAEIGELEREVDHYTALLAAAGSRVRLLCAPTWVVPTHQRGLGMADFKPGGVAHALMAMNARLVRALEGDSQVFVLDAQKWCAKAGARAFDPKLWYLGKIAFGNEVFKAAVPDLKAAFRGIDGRTKKLVIVDLDDTLWGGVVGEVGIDELVLGGHDRIGEAFVDFQHALKKLVRRGVLLGIVSKNEERVALAAINGHPEMVLEQTDFAGWRIDWGDKANHVASLVAELNLGLEDVVFIDDNPAERARVHEALPEVLVPEWPADPSNYAATLEAMHVFDTPSMTWEDSERHRMYTEEEARRRDQHEVGSLVDWLHTLDLKVSVEQAKGVNLKRAVQLLNKTNQMNLSTRRLNEREWGEWFEQADSEAWVFRVEDRFGDSGLTGLLGLEAETGGGRVVDFVLSCRVMGRGVEEALIYYAVQRARALNWHELRAEYLPTKKNKPCLDFLNRVLAPVEDNAHLFLWEVECDFPLPDYVQLQG